MKISILSFCKIIFLGLILLGCSQKKSGLTEESFLGEWYTIKGDVEGYSFMKDENSYIFSATRNMLPVMYGTWKIKNHTFIIILDNGTATEYTFTFSNDTLILNDGEEIYTRTPPLEVRYPEVSILTALSGDFSKLKFSAPLPAYLNWGFLIDSTNEIQEFSVMGYSISAVSTLSSGDIMRISDYITDNGYEPDTIFRTDACNGYRDINQIITLCTKQDPLTATDSISLVVTSGLIIK
jgi:hypothetical protein